MGTYIRICIRHQWAMRIMILCDRSVCLSAVNMSLTNLHLGITNIALISLVVLSDHSRLLAYIGFKYMLKRPTWIIGLYTCEYGTAVLNALYKIVWYPTTKCICYIDAREMAEISKWKNAAFQCNKNVYLTLWRHSTRLETNKISLNVRLWKPCLFLNVDPAVEQ